MIRVLAALLFLQSGIAVAHCLRGMGAGEGMIIEICSTDGMRSIRLDAQGDPAPEHTPGGEGGFCPICHGLPGILLPEPPRLAGPAWLGEALAWHAPGTRYLRPAAHAPPYSTRAPPFTV
ncbi:DUF2946 family protein [Sediminicoccus sp. KRV36]|uniref:DUF2946 family protein n=1 Tax=Sediminicoccus sp. KRV36 TaxID=3133721 RepID=UPI00200D1BDB|nr:DUF2946 family protein [Sediminicoccus rosea]UPY35214.1 DUF2946 family protein [Sediminicoccus rosea]